MVGNQPETLRGIEGQWSVETQWNQSRTDEPQLLIRDRHGSNCPQRFHDTFRQALKKQPAARRHFQTLAPSHRRRYIGWIESATREETKVGRLKETIRLLAAGKPLGLLDGSRQGGEPLPHELRPIAVSTITGLRQKPIGEGDGILQMLLWLGRTPESFMPDIIDADVERFRLPDLTTSQILRWDTRALFQARVSRRRMGRAGPQRSRLVRVPHTRGRTGRS